MKTKIVDWDESFLDLEDYQVERAANNAALAAIQRARRFGTKYVIWENGGVKEVPPEETAPYEKQLQENVDRLSRKIAELEAKSSTTNLELNDKPPKKD